MVTDKDSESITRKKVFISYAWDKYEDWVQNFAEQLVTMYGIQVVLDKWSLHSGDDKYAFMEREVKDKDIDKVLIICDKAYMEKADKRNGGVGTETQILSPGLYENENKGKFIPIVVEKDASGKAYLPIYLKGRMYEDFTDESNISNAYNKLIKTIYNRNEVKMPVLGPLPKKVLDNEDNNYSLRIIISKIKRLIGNTNVIEGVFQNEFLPAMITKIASYKLNDNGLEEDVFERVNASNDLRELYVEGLDLYLTNKPTDEMTLMTYFSKLSKLLEEDGISKDAIAFIVYEQFLITVAKLIHHYNWDLLKCLLNAKYKTRYNRKESFVIFRQPVRSLYEYNLKQKNKFKSLTEHLLMTRNAAFRDELIQADLILFFVSQIQNNAVSYIWYPVTNIEIQEYGMRYLDINFSFLENLYIPNNMKIFSDLTGKSENEIKKSEIWEQPTRLDDFEYVPSLKSFAED